MRILFYVRLCLAFMIFGLVCSMGLELIARSQAQQQRKYDDANINHMKYGLFNVNTWKDKLSAIIVSEIEEFEINGNNKQDLKKHVEGQLNGLIEKFDTQIKESNKNSTRGWIKQKLINAFVDMKEVKQKVPDYADTIVQEMTHQESQKKLKQIIKERVSKYIDDTFEPQDMAEVKSIIQRTGQKNKKQAIAHLAQVIPEENALLFKLNWSILILAVGLFLLAACPPIQISTPFFLICSATLLILIFAGVTCPMIDMIARIPKFHFVLLGHPVNFNNQIVYFQSKSILDVFWILISHKDLPMKIVGVLMILFSIVFPLIKIFFSFFYYYNWWGSRKWWIVRFFVLKSGKWSMTDVLIVAIMMAYIGFNGMVRSQFETLHEAIPQFDFISTNDTTLQIGFYLFLSYVLLAMWLSLVLERKSQQEEIS